MEREFLLDTNAFYNLLRAMNPESKECGTLGCSETKYGQSTPTL